jgi:orc1/cdc6 family replication initiation protein
MIQDARFLRAEFVPSEVVHRDAEVNHLSSVLEPLTRGEPADTALITGPTGSGKTCIAKFTVNELRQENLDVESVYVNCWEDHIRFKALYRLLDEIQRTVDIHRQSTPRDVLLERLREHEEPPCVVVFDEVDQLEDKGILYDLNRLPQYSLILIVNREEELFAGIDDRLESRLHGSERIPFSRYTVDQLVDILQERAKHALVPNAVEESELELIADAASGDARVAITTLRIAARHAEQESVEQITADIIESAVPEARQELRQKNIEALTPHQRAVYEVIEDHEEIAPGDLYQEYRSRVDDPKVDRTIRNYLNKLEQYNLITAEGSTRDRIYRCVGSNAVSSPSPE